MTKKLWDCDVGVSSELRECRHQSKARVCRRPRPSVWRTTECRDECRNGNGGLLIDQAQRGCRSGGSRGVGIIEALEESWHCGSMAELTEVLNRVEARHRML